MLSYSKCCNNNLYFRIGERAEINEIRINGGTLGESAAMFSIRAVQSSLKTYTEKRGDVNASGIARYFFT